MPKASEVLGGQIRDRREKLIKFYEKKGPDGTLDVTAAERDQMKTLNDELNGEVPKYEALRADEIAEERNRAALKSLTDPTLPDGFFGAQGHDGVGTNDRGQAMSFGDLFVGSDSYKSTFPAPGVRSGRKIEIQTELPANIKTLFTRTAGWSPQTIRQPGYVESAQQLPKLVDLIPSANTNASAVSWMLETVFTNNSAPVAEAGPYPESAFALEEQVEKIRKIAHFIPTTDEAIADVSGCRDYLDNRLTLGLKQTLDKQVAIGSGVGENLRGFLTLTGMQAQAQGGDVAHDALFKLMVKIQTLGFGDPSAIWLNPLDWQHIRLFKTSQGAYLFGNPDQVGVARVWGLPVATSTYITSGTGVVGDFAMYSQIFYRAGVAVEVSNSHAEYFTSGKLAIRAQLRAALICTRPAAFGRATFNANGTPTP